MWSSEKVLVVKEAREEERVRSQIDQWDLRSLLKNKLRLDAPCWTVV
jgi:hypothetical protein